MFKPADETPRRIAGSIGDDAVARATGRDWDGWFALLDARSADQPCHDHADTARWLHEEHGLTGWWSQAVTVAWERSRGHRAANQKSDGFAVSVSRTIAAAPDAITAWFTHDALRDRWLEPGMLGIRAVRPGRSARFDVHDGAGRLALWLAPRANGRTVVQLQHERLESSDAVERWRAFWHDRLARLEATLAADGHRPGQAPGADSAGTLAGALLPPLAALLLSLGLA